MAKYYLKFLGGPELEVTKKEYIQAEKSAGFRSTCGPDEVATASFSDGVVRGWTRDSPMDKFAKMHDKLIKPVKPMTKRITSDDEELEDDN